MSIIVEGWVSVRSALVAGNRDVFEIIIQKGKQNNRLDALKKRAKEKNVKLSYAEEEAITQLTEGNTHGGVIAKVGERNFLDLNDLGQGSQAAFLAMLDGVEDPFNFGQAARTLYACGAHGLIVRPRNWMSAASTVTRASAGATEFMQMAIAQSDEELLEFLKARGVQLVCSDLSDSSVSPADADLTKPTLLVVGGERRGISKGLLRQADLTLQIPYGRNYKQALGVTSSAAILSYALMLQRPKFEGLKNKASRRGNRRR